MTRSVIVGAARTPIGKFGGGLRTLAAVDLGGIAIRAALARAGVSGADVDYVIMGQVLQAGAGQITARQAAVLGGIPIEVPALTVNKVCLSGLTAIALADQLIRAGEIEVAVVGGMESMTNAPYVLPDARWGARLGNGEVVDALVHDGLWSTFTKQHMGESSDAVNRELEVSRADQDAWAARSQQRAHAAWEAGRFSAEVTPVEIAGRKETTVVARDEGVRADVTAEGLAALPPAFGKDGTITAGNASQLSDAAAALVVMSPARAQALGATPIAEVVAHGMCADRYAYLHTVPAMALEHALQKAELRPGDLDLLEINEAFAAVALNATRMLGVDEERVNVNGGAVALGHPIGATGARLVVTLLAELQRRDARLGAATLCGGGGQGDAMVLRRVA